MSFPPVQYEDATQCADELSRHCFDGDFDAFHQVFSKYCATHGRLDPFGRLPLKKALEKFGPLAFRTFTAGIEEYQEGLAARWKVWLDVLPLDMQLIFLLHNADKSSIDLIDLGQIKWKQWRDIINSPAPGKTFRSSPLWDRSKGLSWEETKPHLTGNAQIFAGHLMQWKAWDRLDAWMTAAQLGANMPIDEFYIHYSTQNSRGTLLAKASHPLPLWLMGVYAGAVEPAFWATMVRHGGPPFPLDPQTIRSLAGRGDYSNALSWVEPQASVPAEMIQEVAQTGAEWSCLSLQFKSPSATGVKRPTRI